MTVLILADERDPSADLVVQELRRRGEPVFRLDTAWFPLRLTVDLRLRDGCWTGHLRTAHHAVDVQAVTSVWRRAPTTFQLPDSLSGQERQHAHSEAKLGLGGVLMALPVLWLDRPDLVASATYKPVQLRAAAAAGLLVPDTLITNTATAVRGFCAGRSVVTKMLGAPNINEGGGRRIAYTELVTDDHLQDLRGITTTAHQFQQWVDKAYEVRVVVVGERRFAVSIHAGSAAARVDWRSDYASLTYDVIEIQERDAVAVDRLMAALGLQYGALDFVVDRDGRWWFLEINPGGQYGWLEEQAGVQVTAAIADLLTGASA